MSNFYYPISNFSVNNLPAGLYALNNGVLYHNNGTTIYAIQHWPFLYAKSDGILIRQLSQTKSENVCQEGLYFNIITNAWDLFRGTVDPCNKCICQIKLASTPCECGGGSDLDQFVLFGQVDIPNINYYPNFTPDVQFVSGVPTLIGRTNPNETSLIRNIDGSPTALQGMNNDNGIAYTNFNDLGLNIPIMPNQSYTFKIEASIIPLTGLFTGNVLLTRIPTKYNVPTYQLNFQTGPNGEIIAETLINNQAIFSLFERPSSTSAIEIDVIYPMIMFFVDQPLSGSIRIGALLQLDTTASSVELQPSTLESIPATVVVEYISTPIPQV
jgi:hypothetical protein